MKAMTSFDDVDSGPDFHILHTFAFYCAQYCRASDVIFYVFGMYLSKATYEAASWRLLPHNIFFSPILCYDLVVFCTAFRWREKAHTPKKAWAKKDLILFSFLFSFTDLLDWSSTSGSNNSSPIPRGRVDTWMNWLSQASASFLQASDWCLVVPFLLFLSGGCAKDGNLFDLMRASRSSVFTLVWQCRCFAIPSVLKHVSHLHGVKSWTDRSVRQRVHTFCGRNNLLQKEGMPSLVF